MKFRFTNKIYFLVIAILLIVFAARFETSLVEAYNQSGYYLQGSYKGYNQGTYYSQSSYYGQSTYYAQSAYYSQGSYITLDGNVGFLGNLAVSGSISKGSGSFVIDHPLDPANMLLYHSFVESPDVKNIYDGITYADDRGEATVVLPDYFEALNDSYRYQVKGVSSPQPNIYIKTEIYNNSFVIAGATPGAEISWQVTATRKDPFIKAYPIIVEVLKSPTSLINKGEFIFEGYYDLPW